MHVECERGLARFRLGDGNWAHPAHALSLTFAFRGGHHHQPHLRGGVLLDHWIVNGLRGRTLSPSVRPRTSARTSTYGWAARWTSSSARSPPELAVALQNAAIDAQAFFGNVRRGEPGAERSGTPAPYVQDGPGRASAQLIGPNCSTTSLRQPLSDNESFVAGARRNGSNDGGLTCAHHQHLPLYGGGSLTWLRACSCWVPRASRA